MTDKPLIYDLSINELGQVIKDWGEPVTGQLKYGLDFIASYGATPTILQPFPRDYVKG